MPLTWIFSPNLLEADCKVLASLEVPYIGSIDFDYGPFQDYPIQRGFHLTPQVILINQESMRKVVNLSCSGVATIATRSARKKKKQAAISMHQFLTMRARRQRVLSIAGWLVALCSLSTDVKD